MDLKQAGNLLYQIGSTKAELGGSHFCQVEGQSGGQVPTVDTETARQTFTALHHAIRSGLVRSCHDMSEGGLAVAAAEMAFAGGFGATIRFEQIPHDIPAGCDGGLDANLLFSESNSRFLCEVCAENKEEFERTLGDVPHAVIGGVTDTGKLEIVSAVGGETATNVVDSDIATLKEAWQEPLRW